MRPRVDSLEFDEYNESEMARHGVTEREVRQVLRGEPVFVRNAGRHSAPYLMIGRTRGGRLLTIPLEETRILGTWRPATAFPSASRDVARYEAAGGE